MYALADSSLAYSRPPLAVAGAHNARGKVKRSKLRTVQDYLLQRILAGGLSGARKLPSEASLERRLSVSRVTVRNAIGTLRKAGLIHSYQGAGHFAGTVRVALDPGRLAPLDSLFQAFGEIVEYHPVDGISFPEAEEFAPGRAIVEDACLVCLGGIAVCAEQAIFAEGARTRLSRLWASGALARQGTEERVAGYDSDVVTMDVFADEHVAGLLGVAEGCTVLRQLLVLRGDAGRLTGLVQRYLHPNLVAMPSPARGSR